MYSQCDPGGHTYVLFDSLTDLRQITSALCYSYQIVLKSDERTFLHRSTSGWQLYVLWKDRSTSRGKLPDLKWVASTWDCWVWCVYVCSVLPWWSHICLVWFSRRFTSNHKCPLLFISDISEGRWTYIPAQIHFWMATLCPMEGQIYLSGEVSGPQMSRIHLRRLSMVCLKVLKVNLHLTGGFHLSWKSVRALSLLSNRLARAIWNATRSMEGGANAW